MNFMLESYMELSRLKMRVHGKIKWSLNRVGTRSSTDYLFKIRKTFLKTLETRLPDKPYGSTLLVQAGFRQSLTWVLHTLMEACVPLTCTHKQTPYPVSLFTEKLTPSNLYHIFLFDSCLFVLLSLIGLLSFMKIIFGPFCIKLHYYPPIFEYTWNTEDPQEISV